MTWLNNVALSFPNKNKCLLWPFKIGWKGYGNLVSTDVGKVRPHRFVRIKIHGACPKNHEAAHRCGNAACVNPHHLYWATSKQNSADMVAHGTRHATRTTKLTEDDVKAIRASEKSGTELAVIYGVSDAHISGVRSRKYWRHV